ncbi:MAG: hypothetical protein RI601_04850 [Desulfurivibrionaceae bacterium]|nr:hypothetical protein [Desulfurivibrionaceae bacterium]
MKKLAMVLGGMFFVCCPLITHAQSGDFRYAPGDMELAFSGSGSSDESLDGTTLSTEAFFGFFLTESWEAFGRQGFAYADLPGGSQWNASTRVGMDYNFDLGRGNLARLTPMVGASIGWVYGDEIKDQFITGPEVGLKYAATESTFFYGMIEYEFLFENASDADDNFDDGRFVYTVGIGYNW